MVAELGPGALQKPYPVGCQHPDFPGDSLFPSCISCCYQIEGEHFPRDVSISTARPLHRVAGSGVSPCPDCQAELITVLLLEFLGKGPSLFPLGH